MNIKIARSSGFTLTEVLVAMGISAFALLVIMTFANSAYNNFQETSGSIETAESLSRAAQSLTQALTYAANISGVSGSVDTNIARTQKGEIKVNFSSSLNGGLRTVANYVRDAGTDANDLTNGPLTRLQGTSIFFFNPTETTSGVLFINMGSATGSTISVMSPSYSDVFFDRLTEFKIDSPQYTSGELTGLRLTLTARNFLKADKNLWRWCPGNNASAACRSSPFRDISRVVYISFLNQIIIDQNMWSKAANRPPSRLFDVIYFFPTRFNYE